MAGRVTREALAGKRSKSERRDSLDGTPTGGGRKPREPLPARLACWPEARQADPDSGRREKGKKQARWRRQAMGSGQGRRDCQPRAKARSGRECGRRKKAKTPHGWWEPKRAGNTAGNEFKGYQRSIGKVLFGFGLWPPNGWF